MDEQYKERLEDLLQGVEQGRAQRIRLLLTGAFEHAERDPLTQLPRRQGTVSAYGHIKRKLEQYNHPFAVAFMDIDHFKQVNDDPNVGYKNLTGHEAGDLLLQDTARILKKTLRPGDILGRWGGEEFVALLPLVYDAQLTKLEPSQRALAVAERLRKNMETQTGRTISIGVSVYPSTATSLEFDEMLFQADRAMYAAKKQGRNRTILYAPNLQQQVL